MSPNFKRIWKMVIKMGFYVKKNNKKYTFWGAYNFLVPIFDFSISSYAVY